jgi:hypothetical protein
MQLDNYIINDIKPLDINDTVGELQQSFNQLTYSHIPVSDNEIYLGCISETDAHCFDANQKINDLKYAAEGFFVRTSTNWLDILEAFAKNNTNIMPVLDVTNNHYLGYYELGDLINLFHETPFLAEPGGIIIVEKGINDYSFSEISQIVESNNARLLGAFISKMDTNLAEITLKVGGSNINEVLQTFRRYSYEIIAGHEQDDYLESLKERSKYLDRYLNI